MGDVVGFPNNLNNIPNGLRALAEAIEVGDEQDLFTDTKTLAWICVDSDDNVQIGVLGSAGGRHRLMGLFYEAALAMQRQGAE